MKSEELINNPYGFIASNRRIVTLGEICVAKDGIQTGPFGSQLHSADYVDVGTPIIMVEHLGENIIKSAKTPFVSDLDIKRLVKYTMKPGDIIFSRVGYVDKRALVKDEHDGWLFSGSLLRIRPDLNLVDATYLSYFFGFPRLKKYMGDVSVGATRPSINTSILKSIPVVLPELRVQKVIGEILARIDDRIACNNSLSKTLEDIAQTIFKSWFIDFDPVKAKMAGEKPVGMDAATAALFPESMEESELGSIPKGWELKKVEEVLKRITVKGLPKSTVLLNLGRTLVLEQGDSVIAGFIDEDADVEATKDSPAFVFGDHTCRMRISTMPFSIFPNTIVLTSELINTYWAFGATWGLQKFETYRRHWMELAYKVLIVPNTEVANVYGEQVKPMFEIIDSLMVQNRVLSALRDDLLPRLISGELQILDEMLAS